MGISDWSLGTMMMISDDQVLETVGISDWVFETVLTKAQISHSDLESTELAFSPSITAS